MNSYCGLAVAEKDAMTTRGRDDGWNRDVRGRMLLSAFIAEVTAHVLRQN